MTNSIKMNSLSLLETVESYHENKVQKSIELFLAFLFLMYYHINF